MQKSTLFLHILLFSCILLSISACTAEQKQQEQQQHEEPLKIGVLSDIHINTDPSTLQYFLEAFDKETVDTILVLGDIVQNDGLRGQSEDIEDSKEIEVFAKIMTAHSKKTKTPIYIIPGNHESKEVFDAAAKQYQTLNWIDTAASNNILSSTTDSISMFAIPGYHLAAFTARNGYIINYSNISIPNNTRLVISHGPPASSNNADAHLDKTHSGQRVGATQLQQMLVGKNISIFLSGHIHESQAITNAAEEKLQENTYYSQLWANVGAAADGNAAVLFIKNQEASIRFLKK